MPKRKGISILAVRPPSNRRKQKLTLRTGDEMAFSVPLIDWKFVRSEGSKHSYRFNATENWSLFEVRHNFFSIPDLFEFQSAIDNAFENAMRPYIQDLNPKDMFGAYIEHTGLKRSIYLRPEPIKDFDKRRFLNRVFATSQSNSEFLSDGVLRVRIVVYRSLTGRGRSSRAPVSHRDVDSKKKSIVRIRNSDNSCGYRAIALGMKYQEWGVRGNARMSKWRDLCRRDSRQESYAIEFCMKYGFEMDTPMDNDILKEIDSKIDYQIFVIQNAKQVFTGTDRSKVIFLLFDGHHYDLITSMSGYLHRQFYCKYCNRGYQKARDHRCGGSCYLCRSPNECSKVSSVQCMKCFVTFRSRECFANHQNTGICNERHWCPDCERIFTVEKRRHICDEFKCKECNEYYTTQPHYCHMCPIDKEKIEEEDKKTKVLIAYDIECMIEGNDVFTHTPILLVLRMVCDKCPDCDTCLGEMVFYGEDCIVNFVQFLLDFAKTAEQKKVSITVFGHNASGYDGHFLLRELMRRDIRGMDPILNGTKIMRLDVGNIRFIDTLLLFQRPLADLPKMFGLTGEAKGFFPHYANTSENQEMVCHLREISVDMFGRNHMSVKRAADFYDWYARNGQTMYRMKEEMIKYCKSDVRILMEALISFRKLFIETTGIDPLTRTFTLASIGLEYFRAKILPEKAIGITPIGGYNNFRQQSFAANSWLDLMEKEFGPIIREYKIGKYYADGAVERTYFDNGTVYSKIVFEFNGCHFHGHTCGRNYNMRKLEKVEQKKTYYLKRGFWPVFQWECELMVTPEYERRWVYYRTMSDEKLYCDPRKALFGGRTNNLKFTHSNGQTLRYLDFTSLYPYVLSHRPYPCGHPKVIRKNFPPVDEVFGFVSCKVLPPKDLYLPILPYSTGGKLTFPLCRTCADTQNQNSCHHSNEQRCLTGTFVSVELKKALQNGYKIIEIYEILHYEMEISQCFKDYVNVWYKLKAEASGYPSSCKTEEDRQEYIREFEQKEGIVLENVESNPGMRSLAKLMLNTLWGKFAQRPDMPQTKIIRDYQEMWDIFNDKDLEVLGEVMIEDMMLINYKHQSIEKAKVGNTSVAIAAFVTAYARLKLYRELELIEESTGSVLYFDTDSIIFVEGSYAPEIGNFLGEMTDEISEEFGTDARMTEFHSLGPKTYAFKVETPAGDVFKFKAKGITQNIASLETCNFMKIKEMAENTVNEIPNTTTLVPQQQFRCNREHIVTTLHLTKKFNVTSDKRRVLGNDTLPYGFVDTDIEDFANLMTN